MLGAVCWLLLAAWSARHVTCQPSVDIVKAAGECTLARLHVQGRNHEQGNWSVSMGGLQGVISHKSEGRHVEGSESGHWEAAVYYSLKGCGSVDAGGKPRVKRTYVFHSKLSTWQDAVTSCKAQDATLAFPTSEEELKALQEIFSQHHNLGDRDIVENQARLGAFSPKANGQFVTSTGESLETNEHVRWASGQPDNYLQEENCVAILRKGLLNDVPCWLELPFICEK